MLIFATQQDLYRLQDGHDFSLENTVVVLTLRVLETMIRQYICA